MTDARPTAWISPQAGMRAALAALVNVPRLLNAYFDLQPDPHDPPQRVVFGTSGHRGCSLDGSFNEWHVLAIAQAICQYRHGHGIHGPLFVGIDTHALSRPALDTVLSVLAGNGVDVVLPHDDGPTPTPVISHAILAHNRLHARSHASALADGIVITPSHNPPQFGGLKYNLPHGGGADQNATEWIGRVANGLLVAHLQGVKRTSIAKARKASTTHRRDWMHGYINELDQVVDMGLIRHAQLRIGVDPLGGAGVHYWPDIAQRHGLNLYVVNPRVDPTFSFVPLDWDGQIRMDPSSPWAMQGLLDIKDRFDIAFACDTDHDRHGIVCPASGLMQPDHYLAVAIDHLVAQRALWAPQAAIGKTVVCSDLIDRLASRLQRTVFQVPAGFKWFAPGLRDGTLAFAGEDSAGAAFARRDGSAWTTDKDGISAGLLAAEITARAGCTPDALYGRLAQAFGNPCSARIQVPSSAAQKHRLATLTPRDVPAGEVAGEPVLRILTHAPGNGAAIGGLKVITRSGWFVARPSGTEPLYKIVAESFAGPAHLQQLLSQAQGVVDGVMADAPVRFATDSATGISTATPTGTAADRRSLSRAA